MASEGPLFPSAAVNLSNAGSSENTDAWVNPTNVGADDGSEASITAASYDSPDISQILVASGFGFTVADGSTITGIVVEIDRRNSAGAASDNRVQLAKGTTFASLVGSNKADTATDWPTTTGVASYGTGTTDLWGTTWTPAEIRASSFAVFLSVQADAANTDIQVDFIRVTVHYTAPAATNAAAGNAAGTGSAGVPGPSLAPAGGNATGTGAAGNATTTSTIETNAQAGHAAGTGSAGGAALTIVANASSAAGTGTASDAAAAIGTSVDVGTLAAHAPGTGEAFAATVSTGTASTDVDAGQAAGTGQAFMTGASITAGAGHAAGTGAAADATATATGETTSVDAGLASGSGAAHAVTTDAVAPEAEITVGGIGQVRVFGSQTFVSPLAARGYGRAHDASIEADDDDTAIALLMEAA